MKRLDDKDDPTWVKAFIYGRPGTGKTSFGVSAPKPLILLSEGQAVLHVKKAAQRLGIPVPPVFLIEHSREYGDWLRALQGDKSQPLRVYSRFRNRETGEVESHLVVELPEWPETVVVDSLTDASRLIVEGIRQQSPPKKGKDGLPCDSKRFWSVLEDRFKNLVLGFRDLPMHTVFLALADDREVGDDDQSQRVVSPALPMRKLPDITAAAVNVIGYTYRRETRAPGEATKLSWGVLTVGPEYMLLKPYRPLRDVEVPNFTAWVNMIHGDLQELPEAPAPSHETALAIDADEELKAQQGQSDGPHPESGEPAGDGDTAEELADAPTKAEPKKKARRKASAKKGAANA